MKLDDIKKLAEIMKDGERILREQIDEKYKILNESGCSNTQIYQLLCEDQVSWLTLQDWHLFKKEKQRSTLIRLLMLLEGHDDFINFLKSLPETNRNSNTYVPVKSRKNSEIRDKQILDEWNNNTSSTLQSIANQYDISRERVRQILKILKTRGLHVKESTQKTTERYGVLRENIAKEIEIGLQHYGTLRYFEWRDQFYNQENYNLRCEVLKETLMERWNQDLDPLFNYKVSIKLRPLHHKILHLRNLGKTTEEICEIVCRSKPSVTNHIRDLLAHDLIEYKNNGDQIKSVSLDDVEIQKNLDLIRDEIRKGKTLSTVRIEGLNETYSISHYIRRHFLYPHYVNQKKQTEKVNEAIIRLA